MKVTKIIISVLLMMLMGIMCAISTCSIKPKEEPAAEQEQDLQTLVFPEQPIIEQEPKPEIMEVKATAYCPCKECSGPWGKSTATGAIATEGRTIAVDPKVIPYGSTLIIDGVGEYVAEDCGGAIKGNEIDIYFENHKDTEIWGVKQIEIIISKNA